MAIRDIIVLPDARLRQVSEPVERMTDELRLVARDMLDTMYDAPGIGLAAIQVGIPKRMVVIDLARGEEERNPMLFINPQIVWASDERSVYEEGCLSIPEFYEEVERPERIRVRYLDSAGAMQEIEVDGLLSTCLQHEIDHLDGKLFIDYLSKLKRDRVVKRFSKAARREA